MHLSNTVPSNFNASTIFNLPLHLANKFKIPLIIWGENSAYEYGDEKKYFKFQVR